MKMKMFRKSYTVKMQNLNRFLVEGNMDKKYFFDICATFNY